MNITTAYTSAMTALTPVFTAVVCGMLVGFSYRDCRTTEERKLKGVLLMYLSLSGLGWFVTFCYEFHPALFVWMNALCLLCYMMPAILFYRIIRFLTRLGRGGERFSPYNYLLPGVLVATLLIWSIFVPFDVQLEIVKGKALKFPAGYEAYARYFTSKPLLRAIFGNVYYVLTIALLVRYYKKASGKDTLARDPANWVVFLIGISIASLLSSLLPTFMPHGKALYSFWTAVVSLSIACQHILLAYHIIRKKYLLYAVPENERKKRPEPMPHPLHRHYSGKLNRNRLESFFREKKPYLNPNYKMTDLVTDLDVNRTRLSAFINRTYGVNFNRYLNRWRLKELEGLRSLPVNRGKSVSSLLGRAGFGEFRTYSRAVAAEREAPSQKKTRKKKGNDI